jgi:hypothetical protein
VIRGRWIYLKIDLVGESSNVGCYFMSERAIKITQVQLSWNGWILEHNADLRIILDLSEDKIKDRVSPNDPINCDGWPRDWDKHMNKVETRLQALVKAWVKKLKG